jgi:FAD/FMN-containing dehydrogenase
MDRPPSAIAAFRADVAAALGEDAILGEPERMAPYLREWRGLYRGMTPFVLRPADTEGVAAIVGLAGRHGVALVPQGGNTGLVGGQMPVESGEEVVLSTERLDRIEAVDPAGNTITVGAGAILADVQRAADEAGRLFPLSLASEGSARIGGLISTNAGGTAVLAYGSMRAQVLGLEVVLPDGRVWNGLRALRKDNTGYDLKQLFIGAEGTLGIITRAVLALAPKPVETDVAMVAVPSPAAALTLLGAVRGALGHALTAFELLPRTGLEFVLRHGSRVRDPFPGGLPEWAVLVEASTFAADRPMRETLEAVLAAAFEDGTVTDAVVSQSVAEGGDFWRLREQLSEVQGTEGGSIKHDVAVPVAAIPAFLEEATAAALAVVPGARPVPFGHLGDGNIHFNISQPVGADRAAFLAEWDRVNEAVHAVVRRHGGSISAEHGIGRLKRHLLPTVRDEVELDMMRAIKAALDPSGLLAPRRVLPDPPGR